MGKSNNYEVIKYIDLVLLLTLYEGSKNEERQRQKDLTDPEGLYAGLITSGNRDYRRFPVTRIPDIVAAIERFRTIGLCLMVRQYKISDLGIDFIDQLKSQYGSHENWPFEASYDTSSEKIIYSESVFK